LARHSLIVDDNFIGNKKNVRLLLPDIAKWQKEHGPLFADHGIKPNLADDEALLATCATRASGAFSLASKRRSKRACGSAEVAKPRRSPEFVKKIQSYGEK